MKSLKTVLMLGFFLLLPLSAVAAEEPVFTPRDRAPLSMSERGAQVSFAGENEEKGLLELFVKRQDSLSMRDDDLNADQLNRIEPAAGIQFRLEF
jgi:hypothetical protein